MLASKVVTTSTMPSTSSPLNRYRIADLIATGIRGKLSSLITYPLKAYKAVATVWARTINRKEYMAKKNTADELVAAVSKTKKTEQKGDNKVKTIIITVAVTLAVVGAFTATFFAGVNHEVNKQRNINARIDEAVKQVEKDAVSRVESKN